MVRHEYDEKLEFELHGTTVRPERSDFRIGECNASLVSLLVPARRHVEGEASKGGGQDDSLRSYTSILSE